MICTQTLHHKAIPRNITTLMLICINQSFGLNIKPETDLCIKGKSSKHQALPSSTSILALNYPFLRSTWEGNHNRVCLSLYTNISDSSSSLKMWRKKSLLLTCVIVMSSTNCTWGRGQHEGGRGRIQTRAPAVGRQPTWYAHLTIHTMTISDRKRLKHKSYEKFSTEGAVVGGG